jgi:probable phosphoglycerate mutase
VHESINPDADHTIPVLHVLLLRHGLTEYNAQGRVQGQSAVPLNAAGLEQSRRLAARLARYRPRIGKLISSDLPRAVQTAQAIEAALGLPIELDAGWRERGMGELEGQQADIWSAVQARDGMLPRGCETPEAHRSRIRRAFVALPQQAAGADTVAVVTHGGTIWHLLTLLAQRQLPLADDQHLEVANAPNCSITHLVGTQSGGGWRWRMRCMNDADHLAHITQRDAG